MRKLKPFFLISALLAGMSAAVAQPNWHRTYGQVTNRAIDYTSNDEYLLSGQTQPMLVNGWNNVGAMTVLKRIQLQLLDNNLGSQWFKTYVADDEQLLYPICNHLSTEFELEDARQCSNGDYIICGKVRRDGETAGCGNISYHDVFLLRVDQNGAPIWYKRYEVNGSLFSVTETSDGGFMACGYIRTNGNNALILKTDGGGGLQWSSSFNPPAYWDPNTLLDAEFKEVIRYGDYCALVGYGNHSIALNNVIAMIIDDNGTIMAEANYDLTDQDILLTGLSICVTDDASGDLAICGNGGLPCSTGSKLMIMKVNSSLALHWLKLYEDSGDPDYAAQGHGIKCLDQKLRVVGYEWTSDKGIYVETDLAGNLLKFENFDHLYNNWGVYIDINTTLNAPVYSGETANSPETFVILNEYNMNCYGDDQSRQETNLNPNIYHLYETKENPKEIPDLIHVYDLSNNESTVCEPTPPPPPPSDVAAPNGSMGTGKKMLGTADIRMYPNPATSSIVFGTGSSESLSYEIRSVTGQLVLKGTCSNGEVVNIAGLSNGVYFVHISMNNQSKVLKLIKD